MELRWLVRSSKLKQTTMKKFLGIGLALFSCIVSAQETNKEIIKAYGEFRKLSEFFWEFFLLP